MIAYASRTGTRRNLAALREAGWRIMVSATGAHRPEGFRYALDNGAWTAHQQGKPFDADAFLRLYEKLGLGADFVVLPDIVGEGLRSLEFSLEWRRNLGNPLCRQLLAVQDGMTEADVERYLSHDLGVFVGGTTEFKETTLKRWGELASLKRVYLHVGRVNTVRRIHLCAAYGVDSFDGSSVSRFAVTLPKLDLARHQSDLLVPA